MGSNRDGIVTIRLAYFESSILPRKRWVLVWFGFNFFFQESWKGVFQAGIGPLIGPQGSHSLHSTRGRAGFLSVTHGG